MQDQNPSRHNRRPEERQDPERPSHSRAARRIEERGRSDRHFGEQGPEQAPEVRQEPGRRTHGQRAQRFDERGQGQHSIGDQAPEQPPEERQDPDRHEHRHGPRQPAEPGAEQHTEEWRERHEHRHGERNFWREWRDERHQHMQVEPVQAGQALPPKEMEAWREFFHQSFGTWPEGHWIFGGRRFSPWHQGMDSFNPFAAMLLSKGGGLLPLYVLHLVSQQPRYGNEIMDLLAERTNGQWVSNPGAIYPLLTLLEKEGFIEGKWEDPDKRTIRIYTITANGQAEVARISMIVTPKLVETVQVLQQFIGDLQSAASKNEAPGADTGSNEDLSPAAAGTEPL